MDIKVDDIASVCTMDSKTEKQYYENVDGNNEQQLPPYPGYEDQNKHSFSKYPPQPYHTQAPSRTLRFKPTNIMHSAWEVTDEGAGNVLYKAKLKSLKNQMIIKTGSSPETEIATVKFHSFRPKIDISIQGQEITLPLKTKLQHKTTFNPLALQGTTLTWKSSSHLKTLDLDCFDENSMPVAKISVSTWAFKSDYRFEFYEGNTDNSPLLMDELVVTGLAMIHYVLNIYAATTGAAVAGASSASAAAAAAS
ncbi:hypothetical protein BGW36DRAFT_460825 [Talaromyces proteolyticus]|uniref:Uncharacterized protein n=1 Tax=Talaromyces proteolyticus TaxID=1131652 RepID=A0AAD4KYT5_9EURO|nr:uncharacterized protein BGW36DRAFT_460825 [Talaromyces proteolyticus]KAH8699021.1 hypothetical protein BGW36DRAFT_460825 [Talaromyces proteolyticus]